MLLEGKFTSLYRNRINQNQKDSLASFGISFKDISDENKMIVIGDGDMALNDVSTDGPLAMGVNLYTVGSQYEYQFANREFLLNCLEYLVNNPAVIETRNKDIVLRLLDARKVGANRTTWQFINIALPVLLVIIAGLIYQQLRKRRYAV
jgi:gliding-associated putative ABC transporter substrate-binding component GldG